MTDVELIFVADDGSELVESIDENKNSEQVVEELIDLRFLPPLQQEGSSYLLTVEGSNSLEKGQTLRDAGIGPLDRILITIKVALDKIDEE